MSTIDSSDKRILGFRSNKLWKKIVSVSYLCFVGIVLIAGICIQREGKITVTDFLIDKIFYILLCTWLLTPYIFLSNTYLRNKLPFFKKKNFKASFLGMVIVSLVILCFFAITYAFHSTEYKADMQNHAYDIVSKTEATCEIDGKVQYTCNYCGKSTEEILQAFGHSMKEVSRKEPTETKNGEIVKKCENCEKTETDIIEPTTQSSQNTTDTDAPTTTVPSTTTENMTTETTSKTEENDALKEKDMSDYEKLSDKQFKLLTEMFARSFYSFHLEESDYNKIVSDGAVDACLKKICNYAYDHYFEIDPEYKKAFEEREEIVKGIANYSELQENFLIEQYLDNQKGEWVFTITSYSISPENSEKNEDSIFVDAEGYLAKGVELFWKEEGKFEKAGEIEDVAYKKEINGVLYGYAIKIKYYGDPYASGWYDGEQMLALNKKLSGKPLFYVNALDKNRRIVREELDYHSGIEWEPLSAANAKEGKKVYQGALHAKGYLFTIVSIDSKSNIMLVQYLSGNTENKNYDAMVNGKYLYVKK